MSSISSFIKEFIFNREMQTFLEKTTFTELNSRGDRPIVLFGAGNIATKTLRNIDQSRVAFIVDNSKNLQGTKFANFDIREPQTIQEGTLIIICSTAIADISSQLEGLGHTANKDFVISPVLNDLLAIDELERLEQTLYFTSGTVPNGAFGGGLYRLEVKGEEVHVDRVYAGPCYGLIKKGSDILFVDTDKGVMSYDPDSKKTVHLVQTPPGSRAHGISYNPDNGCYYITCSYLDAVIEYDKDFKELRRFTLSNKINYTGEAMHHCNDNLAVGDSLYVTMFSSTGNWKRDSFDGCIAEFDLETGERKTDIKQGLYMPHNILSIEGSLHVLDSLPGHLRTQNFAIQGTFPAFTRGLGYSKGLYFIGQSKNRNFSKVQGLSNNISIDCGIIVWHPERKVSRFIPLSMRIGEVHSIIVE